MGVFSTAMASMVMFYLTKVAGPTFVSLTHYVLPVYVVILGSFLLKEDIHLYQIIGMFVILAGIVLTRIGSNKLAKSLINILHSTFSKNKLQPEVFLTSADRSDGIDLLFKGIDSVNNVFVNDGTLINKRNNRLKNRVFQIVKDQLLDEFWTSKKIESLNKSIKNMNITHDSPFKIAKLMIDEKK